MSELTLQINCCPGDLAYADLTVPRLVAAHRTGEIRETVLVVDTCRPQDTPWIYASGLFPESVFRQRSQETERLVARWQAEGVVDRVEWVNACSPGDLSGKFLGARIPYTHDHMGHAFAAYWLALESAKTRYLLHYDSDIFLHQTPGFSWAAEAIERLREDDRLIAVSPRICPPASPDQMVFPTDGPDTAWVSAWKLQPEPAGWQSDWISTRCFLVDLERLRALRPLNDERQRRRLTTDAAVAALVAPLAARGLWNFPFPPKGLPQRLLSHLRKRLPAYPLPPEVTFNDFLRREGRHSLYLRSEEAWILHPDSKPPQFLKLLPKILEAVASGDCPEAQRGYGNIRLQAWEEYLG